MTHEQNEIDLIVASTLLEIAAALKEGATGPCDFWFSVLAERLIARAQAYLDHTHETEGRVR